MTILITGGSGFIASHLLDYYVSMDNGQVLSYDLYHASSNTYINPNVVYVSDLDSAFRTYRIDQVIHAGARSHVDDSYEYPERVCQDNIQATVHLLSLVRQYKVSQFLYISTDEVYGDCGDGIFRTEDSCCHPTNPYAASKLSAELFCRSWYESYGLPLLVVRMSNVYGPRQHPEKLIPRALTLSEGEQMICHGSGDQRRTFIYISDVVLAIDTVLQRGTMGQIYNVPGPDELSVKDILNHLNVPFQHGEGRPYNDQRYLMNGDKIHALGWYPQVRIKTGLQRTREWYSQINVDGWWPKIRILFWGGRGWIGRQLIDLLRAKGYLVHLAESRYQFRDQVETEIQKYNPTHLISTAGRTQGGAYKTIDYLQSPETLSQNLDDNLIGPVNLAELAQKYHLHFTYFGTGCCFNGVPDDRYGWSEFDRSPMWGGNYATVKGATDILLHDRILNLRIRMPISSVPHPRNLLDKLISYQSISSAPNSISNLDDLLPVVVELIERKEIGTWNLVNPGVITNREILERYREIIDPNHTWIDDNDLQFPAPRSNTVLQSDKLVQAFPEIEDIHVSLEKLLQRRAKP